MSDPNPEKAGPRHWMVKSEPGVYPWAKLVRDKKTRWDGIRSFEARNNLRAMRVGDLAMFYHSNVGKEIVGVARVIKEAYADETAEEGDWSAVDLAPAFPLVEPVTLATIKATKSLAKLQLVTRSRLSVTPVTPKEWGILLDLAKTPREK